MDHFYWTILFYLNSNFADEVDLEDLLAALSAEEVLCLCSFVIAQSFLSLHHASFFQLRYVLSLYMLYHQYFNL